MVIQYGKLERMLTRCGETAQGSDCVPAVKRVYEERLKEKADPYMKACARYRKGESALRKESREAWDALLELDQPYRLCRSVVRAYLPDETIPETLKTLTTDTDRMNAVEQLLNLLTENSSAAWADEQASGEFGIKAPKTVKELDEAITANKAFCKARDDRATTYGPAWERYLSFKRVVRDAYGPTSKQYKRIHIRSAGSGDDGDGGGGEGGGGTPT